MGIQTLVDWIPAFAGMTIKSIIMFIQVIPAKRMPLSLPWLDYSVPEELTDKIKIGQLVKIPFRNREEFGVVCDIKPSLSEKKLKIKPLKEIIFAEPILSERQLNFLADISEFYHVSLGFLLKNNLIPLQKTKIKKVSLSEHSPLGRGRGGLAWGLPTIYNDIQPTPGLRAFPAQAGNTKPTVFIHKNDEEEKEIILKILSRQGGQTLILVPELAVIKKIAGILPAEILNRAITVTSELTNKELFARWLEVWSGEKDIIVGTRTALFFPWFNLTNIILTDEGNPNYKSWDMAPRLHARDGAVFLAKHHGAKLTLLCHTPAVETYYFAQKKVYAGANLDLKPINKHPEIIDMRAERRAKNYSLMSIDLLKEFRDIKDGDVFFFLNRRGTAGYVGCRDCGNVLKCPVCQRSLTYHQDSQLLSCHYCQHSEPMPQVCQKCHGVNVAMYGAGTQLAEELIKKILPPDDKRVIIRIDSDENDLTKLDTERAKIIIGTQLAWPRINWQKIKLFAFLDADAPLFIPEYKIIENLWQQLRDAQFNLPDTAKFIIQTGHPDHLVFQSLFNPENFYAQQLAERQALGYPPFKFLLKLFHGQANPDATKKEAEKLAQNLSALTKNSQNIIISGPLETSPHQRAGQYWQVILAKIKYATYKQSVKFLLAHTPENWKADPNPNSILS